MLFYLYPFSFAVKEENFVPEKVFTKGSANFYLESRLQFVSIYTYSVSILDQLCLLLNC